MATMRVPLAILLLLTASAAVPPVQAVSDDVKVLGTDVAADDVSGLTEACDPVGVDCEAAPCPTAPTEDCSDIDDIVGMSVATVGDHLDFKITVTQAPADAKRNYGQYCWVAAFQVKGDATEYLGMRCETYDAMGAATAGVDDSSRGTEVASGHDWVAAEKAIVIHVPLASINAHVGSVIEDIYALTYISDNLVVDDAAPDTKSDRNAADSFGSYVVGGGSATGSTTPTKVYRILTGAAVNDTTTFATATTQTLQLNWTSALTNTLASINATVQAGSVNVTVVDGAGKVLFKYAFTKNEAVASFGASKAGAWRIFLNTTGFKGSVHVKLAPSTVTSTGPSSGAPVSPGASSNGAGGTGGAAGSGGATGASGTDGAAGGSDSSSKKGTPGFELILALAAMAAGLLAARRRA